MTTQNPLTVRLAFGGLALFLASLALFWPGFAMYDSVAQYGQVLSGRFDDWHPPAMARLWSLFGARGTAPMFVLQMAGYWSGLGLLAAALARGGRHRAAIGVLAIGLWPPLLGWQAVVLKDTQMLGAMLAATGIVAWWRLRGHAVPAAAGALAVISLGYAVLVRANAVFAVVPLAIGLAGRPTRWQARIALGVVATIAILALAPAVNHGPLDASRSGVEQTQALYDLAAIAAATGDADTTGIAPRGIAKLRARHCISSFFWDPLGDAAHCNDVMMPLRTVPPGTLYVRLAQAIAAHPLAYAAHRLGHLNSTERWIVPLHWQGAVPPSASEPNAIGLTSPGRAAADWQWAAGLLVETPLGWPVLFVVAAIGLMVVALRRAASPPRDLALTLLISALTLEASFAVVSIASDLRYHLWPMVATALGGVLLADGARRWSRTGAGFAVAVGVIAIAGLVARIVLPVPPQTYAGMLG